MWNKPNREVKQLVVIFLSQNNTWQQNSCFYLDFHYYCRLVSATRAQLEVRGSFFRHIILSIWSVICASHDTLISPVLSFSMLGCLGMIRLPSPPPHTHTHRVWQKIRLYTATVFGNLSHCTFCWVVSSFELWCSSGLMTNTVTKASLLCCFYRGLPLGLLSINILYLVSLFWKWWYNKELLAELTMEQ